MRAVLMAAGTWPGIAPLNERYPAPMLPLGDRPFVQHVIEHLAHAGVRRFDLILSHLPEKFEQFLGDGKRWGVRITYHLVRDPERPYRLLKAVQWEDDDTLLLGHADRLAVLPLHAGGPRPPLLFCWPPPGAVAPCPDHWIGWALLRPGHLADLPGDPDYAGLRDHLWNALCGPETRVAVSRPLSVETCAGLLDAQRALLNKEFPDLLLTGREGDPGIWLSRNVVLHPTAHLIAPVYICPDSQIGAGVKLGPHAVVGDGCVLDSRCLVNHSLIFGGSYVGPALELSEVIVDKNRLLSPRVGGAVTITEDFILGSLADNHFWRSATRGLAQLVGVALLMLALPVLLLTALALKLFRRGPVLYRRPVLRLPTTADPATWREFWLWSFRPPDGGPPISNPWRGWADFLLRFLPGLVNVARGQLGFVGVPPRSRAEVEALGRDWMSLYLHAKLGLVTEAQAVYGEHPTEDERYAADSFYAVAAGWGHDARLALRYLRRVVFGFPAPPARD